MKPFDEQLTDPSDSLLSVLEEAPEFEEEGPDGGEESAPAEESTYTDDPVRTYLREMGSVSLLTRQGEVILARRMERGSVALLEAIHETRPRLVLFGHVHNPLTRRVRIGRTECVNVGHFRSTGTPYRLSW